MMAMIGAEMVIPLYLQTVRGDTAFQSGLTLLAGALMMGIMSPITGRVFDEHGAKHLALGGLILLTLGTIPFIFLTSDTPKLYVVVLYAIRMFGIAMVMMPVTTSGMNALPMNLISHGTAVNNTVRQIASSMGTAVLISVLSNVTKNSMPGNALKKADPIAYGGKAINAVLNGYHATFLLASLIALVGVFIAFQLHDKRAGNAIKGGAAK
jgi:MFS family permease